MMTPPERMEEVLSRPPYIWGTSAGSDGQLVPWELNFNQNFEDLPLYFIWAARFCQRLLEFGTYADTGSDTTLRNVEANLWHDLARQQMTLKPAFVVWSSTGKTWSTAALAQ